MSTHLSMWLRLLTGLTRSMVSTLKFINRQSIDYQLTFQCKIRMWDIIVDRTPLLVFDLDNWCPEEVSAVILCWRSTQIYITPQLRQQSLVSEYRIKIAGYKEVMVSLTVCEKTNQRNQSFPWRPAVSQYYIGDRNLTTNELFSIFPIASAGKWFTSLNTTVAKFY